MKVVNTCISQERRRYMLGTDFFPRVAQHTPEKKFDTWIWFFDHSKEILQLSVYNRENLP